MRIIFLYYFLVLAALWGCQQGNNQHKNQSMSVFEQGSFGYDRDFVSKYSDVITLTGTDTAAQILVSPTYQGRVLTSTFDGLDGTSLGFINHERIASADTTPHIQAYGGEDRFWLGPQGGQYTIFFNPGDPFDFDHWFTPAPIDLEAFELVKQTASSVEVRKRMEVKNYSGFVFDIEVNRTISMIDRQQATANLGLPDLADVRFVGFESNNILINKAAKPWDKETGLLGIWILGQFPAGATVVMPFENSAERQPGDVYNRYFGEQTPPLDESQLVVDGNVLYYNGSGNYIGKIGLSRERVKPFFGSYHPDDNVLTIVQYAYSESEKDYMNSQWEWQENPYAGDVINAYNDGALDPNAAFTPTFYELESSSPAKELKSGEQVAHYHRTYHFQGDKQQLDRICRLLLGTTMDQITQVFGDGREE